MWKWEARMANSIRSSSVNAASSCDCLGQYEYEPSVSDNVLIASNQVAASQDPMCENQFMTIIA
jgi:hypothetical protein